MSVFFSFFKSQDMFEECSHLHKHVFPKLREFSMSRYGMEFQVGIFCGKVFRNLKNSEFNNLIKKVVNLNFDVKNIEHKQSLLSDSLKEIEKCKQSSLGISFMVILFKNKY
jgi:hypothetical protein